MKSVLDDDSGKPILYVGSDDDFAEAAKRGYAVLSACKDGDHSHRQMLGYKNQAAPKDSNYYHVEQGDHLALNLIDVDDPSFIAEPAIEAGLRFIHRYVLKGRPVLVHCNQGRSRSCVLALLFLRTVGELPYGFPTAEKVFRSMYPDYRPAAGMRGFSREHWKKFGQFKY